MFSEENVGCQVAITDTTMSPTAGHRFVSRKCHRDAHVTQLLFVFYLSLGSFSTADTEAVYTQNCGSNRVN